MLSVSGGLHVYVSIADYKGYRYDDAMKALIDSGVSDVEIEVCHGRQRNRLARSFRADRPARARWSANSTVTLSVSGETVLAPSLTGYTLDNARAYIENEGLKLGTLSEAYSADAAAGTVIAQSVAPNSEVLVGATIDLTIAQSQEIMYYPDSRISGWSCRWITCACKCASRRPRA